LRFDANKAVIGSIQVLALDVLPRAAKIIPLEFGLRFVKGTQIEASDDMVLINKELYLGWTG
jgi:hypothetical protein